ncbi:MAG: hypothetical protein V7K89_03830 [Nostoc sp.]|uniref:hypothetical protein n=1 Tax=Nostoc sp. TaxID=1180 RepID=UPI002FFACE7D
MSLIDLVLGFLLPSDCRDECLGDLYEGYFILRERGMSNFGSILITIGRTLLLILAAFKMRWDDIISSKKDVKHTFNAKHPRHHKNTSYHSDSPKSSLQAVYLFIEERDVKITTIYDFSAKRHNPLFRLPSKLLKYFLLVLLGLGIAFVVSHTFGANAILGMLLSASLRLWVVRIAIFLVCLFAIAMIVESWV